MTIINSVMTLQLLIPVTLCYLDLLFDLFAVLLVVWWRVDIQSGLSVFSGKTGLEVRGGSTRSHSHVVKYPHVVTPLCISYKCTR